MVQIVNKRKLTVKWISFLYFPKYLKLITKNMSFAIKNGIVSNSRKTLMTTL